VGVGSGKLVEVRDPLVRPFASEEVEAVTLRIVERRRERVRNLKLEAEALPLVARLVGVAKELA